MNFLVENWREEEALEQKAIREGFGVGIVKVAEENQNIVVVNADLPSSLKLEEFIKNYPERFFQVGVAEQNMAGIGVGLSHYGKIPFITSFAAFNPGLNFAQIRTAAMAKQNLKIVSSHYGLNVGPDGASAQMESDVAMMKALPGSIVVNPADYNQAIQATEAVANSEGISHLRVTRAKFPVFLNPGGYFEIGKAQVLLEGEDLTVISTGSMVYESLQSVLELSKIGIKVDFLNIHTIKPLDEEAIINSAIKTGKVAIVEEHNIWGGLGESVARVLSENHPTKIKIIGMNDKFGESGEHRELWEKYGLARNQIVQSLKEFIA